MVKSVYLIQSLEEGYYKIGVSKNPQKRVKQLQTGNSSELKLIDSFPSEYAHTIEKSFHSRFFYLKKKENGLIFHYYKHFHLLKIVKEFTSL